MTTGTRVQILRDTREALVGTTGTVTRVFANGNASVACDALGGRIQRYPLSWLKES